MKVQIKPLSVNKAWRGRRFPTKDYENYKIHLGFELLKFKKDLNLKGKKLSLHFVFGYSNPRSDIDNGLKPTIDIMQKVFGFDDKDIYFLSIEKRVVKKGEEFIEFEFSVVNS